MKSLRLMALLLPMMLTQAYSSASDSEEDDVEFCSRKRALSPAASPNMAIDGPTLLMQLKKIKLPSASKTASDQATIRECIKHLKRVMALSSIEKTTKDEGQELINTLSGGRGSAKQLKNLNSFIQNLSVDLDVE